MQFLKDTIGFIKTLSLVDIMFFFAVLSLMLLVITLISFIRETKDEEPSPKKEKHIVKEKNPEDELASLKAITEALENAEPAPVNLSKYEEEQEEKAIISYEELIKRKNDFAINYSEEENIDDDLTIKKVDLDNLVNKEIEVQKPTINVTVISYEKEEAFLKALKTLQQMLN